MTHEHDIVQINAYRTDVDWLKKTAQDGDIVHRLNLVIRKYRRHVIGERV